MKVFRLLLLGFLAVLGPLAAASATTFTVTNTSASGPGSLKQAILDANAHPGLDTVAFNITGSGVHTIAVGDLPLITDPVLIDGYTQPGSSPNTLALGDNAVLLIEIDGSGGTEAVFDFNGPFGAGNSSGSTVRGLVIDHLDLRVGILVGSGFNNGSDNVTITGNFIGTDPTGAVNLAGTNAIEAETSSALTVGGTTPAARNVLSSTDVVIFLNSCTNAVIEGNYIGINAAGSGALSASSGVDVLGGSGARIGGTAAGAGNVIGGNVDVNDIRIEQNAAGTIIQGNLLGTDATGTII